MTNDDVRTTEPDEDRWDLRCDNCGHSLAGCVCRPEEEPMASVVGHLTDALTDVLVERVKMDPDAPAYYQLLEVQHLIEATQAALRRMQAWVEVR